MEQGSVNQSQGVHQSMSIPISSQMMQMNPTLESVILNQQLGLLVEIDFQQHIRNYLNQQIMRPIIKDKIQVGFNKYVGHEVTIEIMRLLFSIIYILKFGDQQEILMENDLQDILGILRQQLSQKYTELFSLIHGNMGKKQINSNSSLDLINLLIFSISYMIHMAFYKHFKQDRQYFRLRFILDCYHITIFELNGIYISDYYLQLQFEKIFTNKFLDYENEDKDDHANQKQMEKKHEKYFLGRKLNLNQGFESVKQVQGGLDFASQMIKQLRFQKNKKQMREQYSSTTLGQKKNNNNNESVNQSGHLKSEIQGGKIRFNCIQISPTVSTFLSNYKMVLPNRRNKMIKHSLEKMDQHNLQDRQQQREKEEQKEKEKKQMVEKKKPKSILDHYNIKVEYDEKARLFPQFFRDMEEHYEIFKQFPQKVQQLPSSIKMHKQLKQFKMSQIQSDEKYERNQQESLRYLKQQSTIYMDEQKQKVEKMKTQNKQQGSEDVYAGVKKVQQEQEYIQPIGQSSLPPIEDQNINRFERKYVQNIRELNGGREEKIDQVYKNQRKQYEDKYQKLIQDNIDENVNDIQANLQKKQNMLKNNIGKLIKNKKI